MVEKSISRTPMVAAAVMLILGSVGSWPYGFYQLLRLVVCGTSIYVAIQCFGSHRSVWAWTMSAIAVLFNPVFIVRFTRQQWQPIDLVVGVAFIAASILLAAGQTQVGP